jgi:Tfp pilus assembly protein PilF
MYLDTRQFRLARKHLARALRLQPQIAAAHHRMANAIESDPEIDARRAGRYYRQALELAPDDPEILADAGFFAMQLGRVRQGLSQLRRAVSLPPAGLETLRVFIEALCEAGRFDEAQRELQLARFRHDRDPRFHALTRELNFRQTRHQQQASPVTRGKGRTVLPFLRVLSEGGQRGAKRYVRRDARSNSRPHFPRLLRRSDSKKVP